uniref:Uncharacterized protein n=1 Tax=Cacopsylla melanoneura TaxID=428564 RepID=A0A8D9F2H1_9HEMI
MADLSEVQVSRAVALIGAGWTYARVGPWGVQIHGASSGPALQRDWSVQKKTWAKKKTCNNRSRRSLHDPHSHEKSVSRHNRSSCRAPTRPGCTGFNFYSVQKTPTARHKKSQSQANPSTHVSA